MLWFFQNDRDKIASMIDDGVKRRNTTPSPTHLIPMLQNSLGVAWHIARHYHLQSIPIRCPAVTELYHRALSCSIKRPYWAVVQCFVCKCEWTKLVPCCNCSCFHLFICHLINFNMLRKVQYITMYKFSIFA